MEVFLDDGDLDILNNATGGVELWRNDMNTALALDSWHYVQVDGIRSAAGVGLRRFAVNARGFRPLASRSVASHQFAVA